MRQNLRRQIIEQPAWQNPRNTVAMSSLFALNNTDFFASTAAIYNVPEMSNSDVNLNLKQT